MNTLTRLIAQNNHFHLPAIGDRQAHWYKEWYHFCILGPEIHAILNLNLSSDTRPAAEPNTLIARVILLVNENGWEGDVDTIPSRDILIQPRVIEVRFGHNIVRFDEGGFWLSIALQNRPISLTLQLEPITLPLNMHNNTAVGEAQINWLVVPRLLATGTITIGERVHTLQAVPAYHDHNWGRWLWGHNLAWEWGFVLPTRDDPPWSIVFDRTTNRARNRVLELTLAMWRGETLQRVFTQKEIQVRPSGYLQTPYIPKFPRVMALLAPENTTDIPRQLSITAQDKDDLLQVQFHAEDVAQVVIPNETDMDLTTINEVLGRLEFEGVIRGETLSGQGRAIFEFLT